MSEIKFVTNGYKIPLTLEVEVDGISVTYIGMTGDSSLQHGQQTGKKHLMLSKRS